MGKFFFECRICGKMTSTTNRKIYDGRVCFSCRTDSILPITKLMTEIVEEGQ